ncbi:hypothetical protein ACROYT_G006117 [Oculina patagonica]
MRNLLLQAFPIYWQDIMTMFQKVAERPFGYLTLDLHPASDDRRRVFSHLLTHEGYASWYRRKEKNSSSPEGEVDYDPWDPLRRKVGENLKESFMAEVKRFLDKDKIKDYSETAAFNALLPLFSKRRLRRIYLERLKWSTHRIKRDALHRKVMKTLRRFISEDDMVFDEAAESAVEKRKFLLNRVMRKKLVPNESDDDEEEEVEASEQQYYY